MLGAALIGVVIYFLLFKRRNNANVQAPRPEEETFEIDEIDDYRNTIQPYEMSTISTTPLSTAEPPPRKSVYSGLRIGAASGGSQRGSPLR